MSYILLYGLSAVFGLIATILWIVLIVKVFKHAGAGLGILSIFCSPFTYIWGWVKSGQYKLTKLMVWITLLILISAGLYAGGTVALLNDPKFKESVNQMQSDMQKALDEAQKAQQEAIPAPQN